MATQNGITSAVGLAIESAWGNVPVTIVSGNAYTVGVATTNPLRYQIVDPGEGILPKGTIDVPTTEIDGSISVQRTIMSAKRYEGNIAWKADPENLFYSLLGTFGSCVQTTAQASTGSQSPAVYQHVYQPSKYIPSFTVEEDLGLQTQGRLTTGCCFRSLELDFGPVLMARAALYGKHQLPNVYPNVAGTAYTSYDFTNAQTIYPAAIGGNDVKTLIMTASPGYVDVAQVTGGLGNGPLVWAGVGYGGTLTTAYLSIDGVPATGAQVLPGFKLSLTRDLLGDQTAGAGYDLGAITPGSFVATISGLNVIFEDNSWVTAFLKHAYIGLNIKLTGPAIGTSGKSYSLEIYCPNLNFTQADVVVSGERMINVATATAVRLGATKEITVTDLSTVSNASLLGTQASAPGGGGGFQTVAPA